MINSGNFTAVEWLLTMRPGLFGLIPGIANPTGISLIVILSVMFICSQPFVRRGGCFEVRSCTWLKLSQRNLMLVDFLLDALAVRSVLGDSTVAWT
jgi:hypothetical protein